MSTLYEQLGVVPSATAAEIKAAWRGLALRYHPDRNEGNPTAAATFKALAAAWEVLGDSERRAAYDATLFVMPTCVQCGGHAIPNQPLCPRCMVLSRVRTSPTPTPAPAPRVRPTPPRERPAPQAAPRVAPRPAPRAARTTAPRPPRPSRAARADAHTEAWEKWANTRVADSDELLEGIMDEALLVQLSGSLPPESKPMDAARALRQLSSTLGAADRLLRQVRSLFG